jgi:methanogenic corrinoid protein MtbC1
MVYCLSTGGGMAKAQSRGLDGLREEAARLPVPSPDAVVLFTRAFGGILNLVNERFSIQARQGRFPATAAGAPEARDVSLEAPGLQTGRAAVRPGSTIVTEGRGVPAPPGGESLNGAAESPGEAALERTAGSLSGDAPVPYPPITAWGFIRDVQVAFGEALRSAYVIGRPVLLVDELHWTVSAGTARGFPPRHFSEMLKAWKFAIHALVKPPESGELAAPLVWLSARLPDILGLLSYELPALDPHSDRFLARLLNRQRTEALRLAREDLERTGSLEDVYERLVAPALDRIGLLWEFDRIHVAQEHAATAVVRAVVAGLPAFAETAPPAGLAALVTCVPGNDHEIGTDMLAAVLDVSGWSVFHIGRSAPGPDLLRAAADARPDAVFLSASLASHLTAARELVRALRAAEPARPVLVGGRAAGLVPDLWPTLGAIHAAGFRDAREAAARLARGHA